MKNKKFLTVGIAVLLSAVMLVAFALTGNAAGNAYEQFKSLLAQEPVETGNMTIRMDVGITDNGAAVLTASGDVKMDKDSKTMSGQFQLSGSEGSQAFEVYKNGDQSLFRLAGSDNWYRQAPGTGDKMESREFQREERMNSAQGRKMGEALLDAFMGDLKDQVVMDETNGLKTFSLTLSEGNMPVLLQTAFQAGNQMHDYKDAPGLEALSSLPAELRDAFTQMTGYRNAIDITSDRKLETVKISITVDENNQPAAFAFSTSFSGNAKDGSAHSYEVACKATLSNLNTTVPDSMSVDPSSIITIDPSQFNDCRDE